MSRALPFVAGGLLALLVGTATAEGPVGHPASARNPDAACAHCHDGPHTPREGQDFQACASCHAEEHWAPSTFDVARHASTAFPLLGRHVEVDCGLCHVGGRLHGLPGECAGCHIDRHRGILGEDCEACHSVERFVPVEGFVHAKSGFALEGPHATAACASCHQGPLGQKLREGKGSACTTCHEATHGDIGSACQDCHPLTGGTTFASARGTHVFDHRTTGFPLERRHRAQRCGSCHQKGKPTPDTRCASCHFSPHNGQLGGQCENCHAADRWSLVRFDHDLTAVPLRGAHMVTPCTSCHTNQRWIGLTTVCWDCHAGDAARAPRTVDAHGFGRVECQDCHSLWRWSFLSWGYRSTLKGLERAAFASAKSR